MPSPAYTKFVERMKEVKRLLALCILPTAPLKRRQKYADRDAALLRGGHVLLCSHLEGFFEDLTSDLVEVYDKLADGVARLPDQLWAHQVLGAPSRWDEKDPAKRWESVKHWSNHPLMLPTPTIPLACMEPELHTETFANPGTNEIGYLFKTIGIPDIWSRFSALEPDQIFVNSINAIVNRRNQIAHGKLDAAITLADAQVYVQRAERIADVFEQIVTAELNQRLALANCWLSLEQFVAAVAAAGSAAAAGTGGAADAAAAGAGAPVAANP